MTNKGQPAYLLVDLAGQNVVSLINWLDYCRSNAELTPEPVHALTPEQKTAAQRFLMTAQSIRKEGLTEDDEAALTKLESGAYKPSFSRDLDL